MNFNTTWETTRCVKGIPKPVYRLNQDEIEIGDLIQYYTSSSFMEGRILGFSKNLCMVEWLTPNSSNISSSIDLNIMNNYYILQRTKTYSDIYNKWGTQLYDHICKAITLYPRQSIELIKTKEHFLQQFEELIKDHTGLFTRTTFLEKSLDQK